MSIQLILKINNNFYIFILKFEYLNGGKDLLNLLVVNTSSCTPMPLYYAIQ